MGKDSDNYGIIGIFVATFRIVYEVMEYKKSGKNYTLSSLTKCMN